MASVGFGGEVKIWTIQDDQWTEKRKIVGAAFLLSDRVILGKADV